MVKETVTLHETIDLLNRLAVIDPDAARALFTAKVSCGQALADHPTIQVSHDGWGFQVGPLGLINGLFGVFPEGHPKAGYGPITMVVGPGERPRFVLTTEV